MQWHVWAQVNVTVQVFLARPMDMELQAFHHCAQVLNAFSIHTSIDRGAEPGPTGLFRSVKALQRRQQ